MVLRSKYKAMSDECQTIHSIALIDILSHLKKHHKTLFKRI